MKEEAEIILHDGDKAGIRVEEFKNPAFVCVCLDFGHVTAKLFFNDKKEVEEFASLLAQKAKHPEEVE